MSHHCAKRDFRRLGIVLRCRPESANAIVWHRWKLGDFMARALASKTQIDAILGSELPAPTVWEPMLELDLVSTRERRDAVIIHLGQLGHCSWCQDGIDAPWRLYLT